MLTLIFGRVRNRDSAAVGSRTGWGWAGVVALAGFYGDGGTGHENVYFVIDGSGTDASRDVGEGVFVAGLVGDLGIEFFDVSAGGGVIDVAPGIFGVAGEALEFFLGQAAAYGQAVHGDVVLEQSFERVLIGEVIELRAVHAIGNDQNDFAAGEAAVVKQGGCGMDGVVESLGGAGAGLDGNGLLRFADTFGMGGRCGDVGNRACGGWTAVAFDIFQIGPELVEVAAESVAGIKVEVESADQGFVVGADTCGNGAERGGHLGRVLGFEVVVDEDDEREREGFGGEDVDGLLDVLIEHT